MPGLSTLDIAGWAPRPQVIAARVVADEGQEDTAPADEGELLNSLNRSVYWTLIVPALLYQCCPCQ